MKKIITLAIVFLLALSLVGCGTKTPPPTPSDESLVKDVATKYITALQSYDYTKLNTIGGLEFTTNDWGVFLENNFPQMLDAVKKAQEIEKVDSVQVDSIVIKSATEASANLKFTVSGTRSGKEFKENFEGPIKLFKINGGWYVGTDETKKVS